MKKLWERLKDAWYGLLPLLILFGIPLVLGAVIGLVCIWDDIPKILSGITDIGNGSLFYGVVLVLFSLIGLINAFAAFMLWAKAFFDLLERKAMSTFGFWFPIIVVALGWYAMFELVKIL